MIDIQRYKIDTLLKMAKTTTDDIARENFIAEANAELKQLSQNNSSMISESIKCFVNECVVFTNSKETKRDEIEKSYKEYCENNNFAMASRNVLYGYLRDMGCCEKRKSDGRYFLLELFGEV